MTQHEKLTRAIALHQQGRLDAAMALYKEILNQEKSHFDSLHLLGVACIQTEQLIEAQQYIEAAIQIDPEIAVAHYNHGCVLKKLNRLQEALQSYDKTLELVPDYADAYLNRGNIKRQLGEHKASLKDYDASIALKPKNPEAYTNKGNALQDLKKFSEALACYDKAIELEPNSSFAHNNRAVALKELRRFGEALESVNHAIALRPGNADAHNNKAVLLQEMKQYQESLEEYDQTLRIDNNFVAAHVNRGIVLWELKQLEKSRDSYANGFKLNPEYENLHGIYLHSKMHICDWDGFDEERAALEQALEFGKTVSTPFTTLGLLDRPDIQLKASQMLVNSKHPSQNEKISFSEKKPREKIKVGYYSADFHSHATAYLMAELFEAHDSNQFEIFAFSFGPNKQDDMRQRVQNAFDQFYDVTHKSDHEVAALSRALGIDIAIDLKGFTQNARTGIFAERCAPIQVNYLGYPGTMGAPYIDYLIADKTVIPETSQKFYTEKIVYLQDSYQVNDAKRLIADRQFTRAELGLPEDGFVFCCFNNNYKILPETFDRWMKILQAVPGSVLWLLGDNAHAASNLRIEAQKRGIDPKRLVFAPRMPLELHLARHRQADLFLDTFPCNAHTTASDALWAGLPVLTLLGASFAARVAASLLRAIGLDELIASKPEAFEQLAVQLAQTPRQLADIRNRLYQNRMTSPLFNGQRFARHLESAYRHMVARQRLGLPPEHFEIKATRNKGPVSSSDPNPKPFEFMDWTTPLQVMDIGSSAIAEVPIYKVLLDKGWAFLQAFEGDYRQIAAIKQAYPDNSCVHQHFLFDGTEQTLYMASGPSGMTSLLKPDAAALGFFNGFNHFGHIERTAQVQTVTLDSVKEIPAIDFLKMDIQGAELTVLTHGQEKLKDCLAIQLEVSYICLYEQQPTFGEIDCWMRAHGYVPHRFLDIKRWSISPTIFNNNFRVAGNQLLESDIVYIKNPMELNLLSEIQISKMAVLAHYAFGSIDLCVYMLRELVRRGSIAADAHEQYIQLLQSKLSASQTGVDKLQSAS